MKTVWIAWISIHFLNMQDLIRQQFGEKYLSAPQFDISSSFGDSTCQSPLIFILSPGSDPIGALYR